MAKKSNRAVYISGFAPVPYGAMRDTAISIEARGLLALLMTHSANWEFHRSDILKKCGCGKEKYDRMIRELKSAGYLDIKSIRNDKGHIASYDWIINADPSKGLETQNQENPESGKPAPISITTGKDNNLKEPPSPLKGELDPDDIFEKLWPFIRKTTPTEYMGRHSKKDAKAKFRKIATRKKDPVPAGKMAHAICWFYSQEDQQRDGGKYIKGIVPVLNGELFAGFMDKGPYGSMGEKSVEELAAEKDATYWDFWIRRYRDQGDWNAPGPNPDEPGCLADRQILTIHGFEVPSDSIDT